MTDGCALDADKNLKSASDIEFFESETDLHPIGGHVKHTELGKGSKAGSWNHVLPSQKSDIYGTLSFQANDVYDRAEVPKVPRWLSISLRST